MTAAAAGPWDELRDAGMLFALAAGETLFAEGDPADGVYVVLSGRCAVAEHGDQVDTLVAGDLFGEVGALSGGTRTATVSAINDVELVHVPTERLHREVIGSGSLVWQLLRLVVERTRSITGREIALREEHKALREVQRSLLPDPGAIDADAGFSVEVLWEPCTFASGDYFDVVRIDADRHLVALGDVMGHGAEASLMMAVARAQVRELARASRRTDELLLRLDGYLRDNAPQRQGMSLFVAVFDRRDRVLEYSSAGHPFPFLARAGTVDDLPGRPGLLLSLPLLAGAGYERRQLELQPGDELVLFTDGLYEVEVDPEGTQLGREGLRTLVAAAVDPADETSDGVRLARLAESVASVDRNESADDDRSAFLLTVD